MFTDKMLAIVGLIGVAIYAIYQGGPESYSLVNTIVAAVAGFVTGSVLGGLKQPKTPKEETPNGDNL